MKGYITNIEQTAMENNNFREVLYTAKYSQLVVMSLNPLEEIGEEVHELDQFIKIESGQGKAILNGSEYDIEAGSAIVIPAGTKHNIINSAEDEPIKLYTIYSPPEHRDEVAHATKEEALADDEHFDGQTTE